MFFFSELCFDIFMQLCACIDNFFCLLAGMVNKGVFICNLRVNAVAFARWNYFSFFRSKTKTNSIEQMQRRRLCAFVANKYATNMTNHKGSAPFARDEVRKSYKGLTFFCYQNCIYRVRCFLISRNT